MVTELTAGCRLAGGERVCALLDSLAEGEEIALVGDGTLVLVYPATSSEYRYRAPVRLRIQASAPALLAGNAGEQRTIGRAGATGLSALEGMNLGQAALVLRGAERPLEVLSPVDTMLIERTPPVFRWRTSLDAVQFRFVLTHESGRRVLETLVRGEQLTLPGEVTLEEGAWYEWQVETRLASGEVYSDSADFSIAAAAERERLAALRPAAGAGVSEHVLYAAALEHAGAYARARDVWAALARAHPDNDTLRRLAGN